jgi:RHS repeat-associated protein
LVTVSDRKIQVQSITVTTQVAYYEADIVSANDYYPFGMAMPGRSFSSEKYRYGFNGKEKDNSTGEGNYDYGARIYDGRIGRWLSADAFYKSYPSFSPYIYALNIPTQLKDEGGNWVTDKDGKPIYTVQGGNVFVQDPNNLTVYYLTEQRTYYTNGGKEVKLTAYLKVIDASKVTEKNNMYNYDLADLKDLPDEKPAFTYDCHGNTCFEGESLYIPGSIKGKAVNPYKDNPGNIFRDSYEYEEISYETKKKGDIALFGKEAGKDSYGFSIDEVINHSATFNGDKDETFTTKDDRKPLNKKATISGMESDWGGFLGYVRHLGNQKSSIISINNTGEVTLEQAKLALKEVKQRINPKGAAQDDKNEKNAAEKKAKAEAKATKKEKTN